MAYAGMSLGASDTRLLIHADVDELRADTAAPGYLEHDRTVTVDVMDGSESQAG